MWLNIGARPPELIILSAILETATSVPSKYQMFTQRCFDVGPPSATLAQHLNNAGYYTMQI